MTTKRKRSRVLPTAFLSMALLASGACERGISYEEYDHITAWLTCDDCLDGERDSVAAIGRVAATFLEETLDSLPGSRRDNMRAQYLQLYDMLPAPTMSSDEFVEGYLATMDATVRMRSIASLGDVGAENVLQTALNEAVARGYGPEVVAALEAGLVRNDLPPIDPGPADAWTVTGPSFAMSLCNGMGSSPCDAPEVPTIDLEATAEGPTGVFGNPWVTGTVYFFYRRAGSTDPPRLAGTADGASALIVDNGITRFYTWTVTLSGHGIPTGPIEVFAVGGLNPGTKYRTAENLNITVIEGN